MSPIAQKVISIVAQQAGVPAAEITLDHTPETLGLDSLGLVEAMFAIEESFNISIPFNANDPQGSEFDVRSVRLMVEAVERLLAGQPA